MADSAIRYQDIDEEFPVPGQDNDSQGFRDNFSEIKIALETANLELTDLKTSAARVDGENDFNGNNIINANLRAVSGAMYAPANINADTQLEWNDGVAQKLIIASDVALTFTNFPTGGQKYAATRLILKSDGGSRKVTFETGGTGSLYIANISDALNVDGEFILSSSDEPKVIDAWSDNGQDIYLNYIGEFVRQS